MNINTNKIKRLFNSQHWMHRRVKVYSLVGPTGSGKSFRAKLIMEKYHIQLLIDDGLLISDHRILAGKSAKREQRRITAIKRAIFDDLDHLQDVRKALRKERFQSILIIGTSDRMVGRIAERLELPCPDQVIYIDDVATPEEIATAKLHRKLQGKHVIPVPVIEVKKDPSHHILDSVRLFLEHHPVLFWKKKMIEKTIVQPPFSRRGNLTISESAFSQMIMHCAHEFNPAITIRKIIIETPKDKFYTTLHLSFPFGIHVSENLSRLHEYIISNIERHSGIYIDQLDITVDQIEK